MHEIEFIHGVNTSDDDVRRNVEWALAQGFNEFMDRRCLIVGGGPSIDQLGFADDVRRAAEKSPAVFALNQSWRWLLMTLGLDSDYIVMMDARPENADFVGDAIGAEWLIASQCDKSVFEELKDYGQRFKIWHAAGSEVSREKGLHGIVGGGTVLSRTINIAYMMGYRHMTLAGVDSSYADGQHHAYDQPINDGADTVHVYTKRGTEFTTTGTLAAQADYVFKQMRNFERVGVTFNIIGEGLLPAMWREREEDKANADKWEPEKYARMWDFSAYRGHSPAMEKIEDIIANLEPRRIQIVDFGCGSGRATAELRERGFDVLGVDFAPNCLDADIKIPFAVANLWDLPAEIKGDQGVCCDVMEHIPPEKVDAVLSNIAKSVPKCIFSISYRPDQMGALIGEKLHLSVHSEGWWVGKLAEHFASVTTDNGLIICEVE